MSKSSLMKVVPRLCLGGEHTVREEWGSWLSGSGLTKVFTPNPEQVVLAHEDPIFEKALLSADILLPDGAGLVFAARALSKENSNRIGRVTGTDLLDWWLGQAEEKGVKTFLLGSTPGVAQKLAKQSDPLSRWCYGMAGYENVAQPLPEEEAAILDAIKEWSPKVLWVAFGAPYQEQWVLGHEKALQKMGVRIVVVCGGAFNYLVGDVSRAPKFLQNAGLEWLYRLVTEPWRWRRQLRLPYFLFLFGKDFFEKLKLQVR